MKRRNRSQHKGTAQQKPPPHLPIASSSCHFKISPGQLGRYLPYREHPYNPWHFKVTLNTHFSCISSMKQVTLRLREHLFHCSPFTKKKSQTLHVPLGERRALLSSCWGAEGTSSCWKAADHTTSHTTIKLPPCLWEPFHINHTEAQQSCRSSSASLRSHRGLQPAL